MLRGNHTLERIYRWLTFLNDVLLIPLFTLVTLETCAAIADDKAAFFGLTNIGFCFLFGAEWAIGLAVADNRLAYMRNPLKLADLISSIPVGQVFQSVRVVRLLRIMRLVRAVWRAKRYQAPTLRFLRATSVIVASVGAGALAMRVVEPETVPNAFDAIWWSLATVTTSSAADIVPHSGGGRVVAAILSTLGVGIFGYIAGFLSTIIEDPEEQELLEVCGRLEAKLDALSSEVEALRSGPRPVREDSAASIRDGN